MNLLQFIPGNVLDPALTLFGATASYVFTLNKLPNSLATLRQLMPNCQEVVYARLDAAIVILSGWVIGMVLFAPTNHMQALVAGFTWAAALKTLLSSSGNTGSGSLAPAPIPVKAAAKQVPVIRKKSG